MKTTGQPFWAAPWSLPCHLRSASPHRALLLFLVCRTGSTPLTRRTVVRMKPGGGFRSVVHDPQGEHCTPSLPRRLPAPPQGPGQFCNKRNSVILAPFLRFKQIFNGRANERSHRMPGVTARQRIRLGGHGWVWTGAGVHPREASRRDRGAVGGAEEPWCRAQVGRGLEAMGK